MAEFIEEAVVRILLDALQHDLSHARLMLEAGVDVNKECNGIPPLHFAARESNLPACQLLLEFGADLHMKHSVGNDQTALHYAAHSGADCYEIYKFLLENGANCNEGDYLDVTPFHNALAQDNMRVVQLFLEHGADITAATTYGATALHHAAFNRNNTDVLQFVLKQGLDIDARTRPPNVGDGMSPLCIAATSGNPEGCEILIKHGAMVNKKGGKTGHTPLSLCIVRERAANDIRLGLWAVPVVQVLLEYGAEVSHTASESYSILELAVACSPGITNILMQHVAKIKCLTSKVREADLQTIERNDCYREYYQRCLQEIEMMKEARFYNSVTLFHIFMSSDSVISGYARNEELVRALEENTYDNSFPIYFSSLKKRFCTIVERQRLRDSAAKVLSIIFDFNDQFHPVNRNIIYFLSGEDLKILRI